MVTISTYALELIEEDRRKKGIPPSLSVRIFTDDRPEGPSLKMAYVDDPERGDRTLEEHGTEFYLASEIVESLKGVTVDAVDLDPPQLVFLRNSPQAVLLSREAPEDEENDTEE